MEAGAIAAAAVSGQAGSLQDVMGLAMVKQAAQQGQAMANMLMQAAETTKEIVAAPPPGMGQKVDISA
jgi:hypothetical protein